MSDKIHENGNGWSKYEIYVLETLERLEGKLDNHSQRLAQCHDEITKVKNDYKWHVRVFTGVWAIVVTAINIAISIRLVN